jgi:hypothetical protein
MKKNQKKTMGIAIPTINLAGFTGFGKPMTAPIGIAAAINQIGAPVRKGVVFPAIMPKKSNPITGMIRGPTRRRDGEYTLTPADIAEAESMTGEQMAALDLSDSRNSAMMNRALQKREREIGEDRKSRMSEDDRDAYEKKQKQDEANRGKKRRSNLDRYAKGIQKTHSFRGTIREFVVPEEELSDTPQYLRNKKIINIYCNDKGIMSYEPKPGEMIDDITKGPIVSPSPDDVHRGYVFPRHASWYRDQTLNDEFGDMTPTPDEMERDHPLTDEEAAKRFTPEQREYIKRITKDREAWEKKQIKPDGANKRSRKKPAQKRGSAAKPGSVTNQTGRKSQ